MVATHLITTVVTALVLVIQDRAAVVVGAWLELLTKAWPSASDVSGRLVRLEVDGTSAAQRVLLLLQSPRRGPPGPITATP